jgi:hypothetical protein
MAKILEEEEERRLPVVRVVSIRMDIIVTDYPVRLEQEVMR